MKKVYAAIALLIAMLITLLLMEGLLHLLFPTFRLTKADEHFSPRCHHGSDEMCDVTGDYLYQQELSPETDTSDPDALFKTDFAPTILQEFESYPVRFLSTGTSA